MKSKVYSLMIVDDHALFRDGLKLLLNSHECFKVIAEASNGKEFLDQIDYIPADVVLMDISMPEVNGIEACERALKIKPNLKIITLSMYGDEDYYYKMLDAGASGFLLKESDIDEVYTALFSVIDGKNYFSQELLQNLVNNIHNQNNEKIVDKYNLTEREIEIINYICKGYSNIEIADKMFVSKRTVEKHRANILSKTEIKNTASLVMFAIKNGIVEV